jgi:Leucine-rich repeat (LRR) protein|tara:strand:+ start:280 stop:387 length:108 start_codon:yes stop_codon:yes gene_type:complete
MWVPGVLGKLKNLKKLYLEGNNIMHVDDDLGKLAR